MNHIIKAIVGCAAACFVLMLIAHRRVIAAYITGEPMPEAPEWHRKHLKHCGKE